MSIFKTIQDIAKEQFQTQNKLDEKLHEALTIGNTADIQKIKNEQKKEKVRRAIIVTLFTVTILALIYLIYWAVAQGLCKFKVFGEFCKSLPGVTIVNQNNVTYAESKVLYSRVDNLQNQIDTLKDLINNKAAQPFYSESTVAGQVIRAERVLCVGNICVNESLFRQTFGNGSGITTFTTSN